jgi:uncharacterized protein (DUF433 family)
MATELRTEHPHIVRVPGVLGGEPIIAGTRIGVAFIARLLQAGDDPAELAATWPHITPAALYDAISYYHDHRDEIDALIDESSLEEMATRCGCSVGEDGKVSFETS